MTKHIDTAGGLGVRGVRESARNSVLNYIVYQYYTIAAYSTSPIE